MLLDERGFALPMALGIITVLAISGTTIALYSASGVIHSGRSKAVVAALALGESGMNDAQSVLYNSASPTSQAGVPGLSATKPAQPQATTSLGKEYYWGAFDSVSNKWTLYGLGVVKNTGAAGSTISRQVSHRIQIVPGKTTPNLESWNGLFANATSGCTTLGNGITVTDPAYIRGNLCISGGSRFTGSSLQVDGNLSVVGGSSIGASGSPIQRLSVAGSTSVTGGSAIYATQQDRLTDQVTEPTVNIANWYTNADIGPNSACTSTSGTPPNFSDANRVQDWNQAAINLTPLGTAYSCTKTVNGSVVAQLVWNGSNSLQVKGVVFFDGPVLMNAGVNVVYSGMATIYASTFSIGNGANLCGINGCTSSWDTSTNLLVLVAGQPAVTDYSLSGGSTVQAAIYCVGDVTIGNGGTDWGPITANQITISGGAILPRSVSVLPNGAPENTMTGAPTLASDPNSYNG